MQSLRTRPWLIGALSGALVFAGLKTLDAQGAFGIADVAANPANYWGKQVTVSGLAANVRQHEKSVGKAKMNVVSLSLYEPSGNAKHPRGKRYISVTVPVEAVGGRLPADDAPFTATGVLKAPSNFGDLEPR